MPTISRQRSRDGVSELLRLSGLNAEQPPGTGDALQIVFTDIAEIVAGLGIADLIDKTITSAAIGYEKPHPEAFAHALVDVDPTRCWMIGDSPAADIDGAAAAGMHAVLVRHPDARVQAVAEAVELMLSER